MLLSPAKMKTISWLSQVREAALPLSHTRPYWVRSLQVRDKKAKSSPLVPPEQHPYCEFNMILQGSGQQFIGPERFYRKAGDLMVLGPGIPHYGLPETYPQRAITVFFLPTLKCYARSTSSQASAGMFLKAVNLHDGDKLSACHLVKVSQEPSVSVNTVQRPRNPTDNLMAQ